MKCVCGYEYEEDWEDCESGKPEIIKGDEDFVKIDCHVTVEKDYQNKKVELYACPKCNTIQVLYH